jgi:Concanavalin A-like lectin/glucanases superfamily/IPT/TIG domain
MGSYDGSFALGTTNLKDNTWHYIAGSYTPGGTINIYVDGTLQTNSSCPNQSTNYGTSPRGEIGSENVSGNTVYFNGVIDEVRVSSISRSADWITTEYNNQSSPSTFYTIGSAQGGGPDSWGPTITSLSPSSGSVDTPITITGTNFGLTQNGGIVNFNGVLATVTSWSSTSIVALVPDGATSGNVTVRISGATSNGASFTVNGPVISTLSPTQGPVGASVVITGTGFGTSQGSSTVKFNGTAATASAWNTTSITVAVPAGATSGGVIVTVSNVPSDDAPFTVTGTAPSSTSDIYYYFSDALATTRVITGSDGTVCYDADLYPYGGVRVYNSNCGPGY